MMISHFFSASISVALFSVVSFFAIAGAVPPGFEVVKNTGSMCAKSPSSCMRCIRTEPTMPRQPTKPTSFIIIPSITLYRLYYLYRLHQGLDHGVAHRFGADLGGAGFVDVGRAQALRQHLLDGVLDTVGLLGFVEREAQHHRGRQDRRQRIGDALA